MSRPGQYVANVAKTPTGGAFTITPVDVASAMLRLTSSIAQADPNTLTLPTPAAMISPLNYANGRPPTVIRCTIANDGDANITVAAPAGVTLRGVSTIRLGQSDVLTIVLTSATTYAAAISGGGSAITALATTGAPVEIWQSAAPAAGDLLVAANSTQANWTDPDRVHISPTAAGTVRIGEGAQAGASNVVAVGENTVVGGPADAVVALGPGHDVRYEGGVALGASALIGDAISCAIVYGNSDTSCWSVEGHAIGCTSSVTGGDGAMGHGTRSRATGSDSLAWGRRAQASGAGAIAVGGSSTDAGAARAVGNQCVAYGQRALASGASAAALGPAATANQPGALAVGWAANAGATGAIAAGVNARALSQSAAAWGATALVPALAPSALAIGMQATAGATGAVAVGSGASAGAVDSIAVGTRARVFGSVLGAALGGSAMATGASASVMSIGVLNQAWGGATGQLLSCGADLSVTGSSGGGKVVLGITATDMPIPHYRGTVSGVTELYNPASANRFEVSNSGATSTLSAAQMRPYSFLEFDTSAANIEVGLAAGAAMDTLLRINKTGSAFPIWMRASGANTLTVTAGVGMAINGTGTIPTNEVREFQVRKDADDTYQVYAMQRAST